MEDSDCLRPYGVQSERWAAAIAHRERLLRIARARTPSADDAEDIVQEALLRCAEFEGLDDERLGRFLTSVTVRLCIDEHRRRSQSARLGRRLEAEPAEEPGSDEYVCDRLEANWVAGLVAGLPPRQREVLAAKAEGMSCGEIGNRYRMSYKAVESALTHARRTVRAALTAASCLVVGTLARVGWRSRMTAVAIIPVVAATLVIGAYRFPDLWRHEPPGASPAGGSHARAGRLAAGPGPAPAPAIGTPRPTGAPKARPVPSPQPSSTGIHAPGDTDDQLPVVGPSPGVDDYRPATWSPDEYARECLRDGVTVEVVIDPDDLENTDNVDQDC